MESSNFKKLMDGKFIEGNLCILMASIFWGANIAFTKNLIPDWMSAYGITCIRLIGGCVLFWIASLFVKCEPVEKGDWIYIITGGAIGLFTFIFLNISAVRFGSAIDISIIMTLPSMIVILIDYVFRHIKPGKLELTGVIVSFIGAAVIILSGSGSMTGGSDYILGDILAILSALCYAFYLVIMEKPTRHYRPVTLLRWVFLFAAIPGLLLIPGMQNEQIFHQFQMAPWLEISYILFFPTFIAYFLVQPAIKDIGPELVSLYQYTVPAFAAITCVLIGIEHIVFSQVVAMAIIITGMIMVNIGKRRKIEREKEEEQ